MGFSTSYYTVDGEIIGESTNGIRLDYLTDALGSVTAKVDQEGSVDSTARYKPYGDLLSGSTYKFGWIGSYGYRISANGSYVRNRDFSSRSSLWTSIDGFWPYQPTYNYCSSDPIGRLDYGGQADAKATRRYVENGSTWPPTCGGYLVLWSFSITPKLSGWLIQKIKTYSRSYFCDGTPLSTGCGDYYEAWRVVKGIVQEPIGRGWRNPFPNDPVDRWSNSAKNTGFCTYGSDFTQGSLQFVEAKDLSNNWLTAHGFAYSNDPKTNCSGDLPFSRTPKDIPMTFADSPTSLLDNWFCCKDFDSCFLRSECIKCWIEGPCLPEDFEPKVPK